MTMRWVLHRSVPLVVILLTGLGCGGKDVPSVTGKVTYDGKPADGVQIKLTAPDGTSYIGTTHADGSFTILNVKDGEMAVTFETAPDPNAYMIEEYKKRKAEGGVAPKAAPPKAAPPGTPLPTKYRDAATSGQTWKVEPSNRTQNFNLAK